MPQGTILLSVHIHVMWTTYYKNRSVYNIGYNLFPVTGLYMKPEQVLNDLVTINRGRRYS